MDSKHSTLALKPVPTCVPSGEHVIVCFCDDDLATTNCQAVFLISSHLHMESSGFQVERVPIYTYRITLQGIFIITVSAVTVCWMFEKLFS